MKPAALPMMLISALSCLAGCHQQRYGMFESYEFNDLIHAPPPAISDRAGRDLERAIPALVAELPEEARSAPLAVLVLNHAGDPVAHLVIGRPDDGPPMIAAQAIDPYRGHRRLRAPTDGWARTDAERVNKTLDQDGQAFRFIDDADRLTLVLPGGGDDDEVWLHIPLTPGQGRPEWSYGSDAGDTDLGSLAVWTVHRVVRCRAF